MIEKEISDDKNELKESGETNKTDEIKEIQKADDVNGNDEVNATNETDGTEKKKKKHYRRGPFMNVCCLIGDVVSEMKYDFIINSKEHTSMITFDLEMEHRWNGFNFKKDGVIKIVAYDNVADRIYKYSDKIKRIGIEGRVAQDKTKWRMLYVIATNFDILFTD